MRAFVWVVTLFNAAILLLALVNAAFAETREKRLTAVSAIITHGAFAAWGTLALIG